MPTPSITAKQIVNKLNIGESQSLLCIPKNGNDKPKDFQMIVDDLKTMALQEEIEIIKLNEIKHNGQKHYNQIEIKRLR